MAHVACESKLQFSCEVIHVSMHNNSVSIGRAVVYHALAAHAFRAGIQCQHCICRRVIDLGLSWYSTKHLRLSRSTYC